jgi:uncharacterized protein YndB with AHSA1/START domain
MSKTISPAPVRREVTVKAPPARAFQVFTAGMGAWWPKSHHIGPAEAETIVIEPRQGGRWFERQPDGSECEIGHVMTWDPPTRLVLGWQLSPDWRFDKDLLTEVELRFVPLADGSTRVELEHRNLEAFGERAEAMRQNIDSAGGWPLILQAYAEAASQVS